ncbi:hypothetical protein DYD21_04910 [Rhodohalobacter sp. SW132]|uniref:hypothetical protein n=1 Tax=Rhodohalobacter sp. SW132 TaxID=2293433 RepID=UPI000E22824F|nr:hypothetical protein [Rhodohalobacter sp. SW132]REL37959.1 hypothetical protein DYD21_04910 [Rhodohalobacter sp. SW132]
MPFLNRKQILLSFIATFCFTLGFMTSQSIQKTNWVGYMVHGIDAPVERSLIPQPDGFKTKVEGQVVIGLRDDGVVVWKHVESEETSAR